MTGGRTAEGETRQKTRRGLTRGKAIYGREMGDEPENERGSITWAKEKAGQGQREGKVTQNCLRARNYEGRDVRKGGKQR